MSQEKKHYKTIVISDTHFGSKWSKTDEVTSFLKQNTCETLILCGDIIDGWAILRGKKEKWKEQHSSFVRRIFKIQEKTKVYYLRGNHDDFLNRLAPIELSNISILEEFIYESNGKKFLVFHGDVFDNSTAGLRWVSKLGDVAYSFLLNINEIYNNYRLKHDLPYYSISARIKQRVKKSVAYNGHFENQVINLAKGNDCDGIICGHIHHPEIRMMDDIIYMNSGDWVESLSALVEDFDGNWKLVYQEKQAKLKK